MGGGGLEASPLVCLRWWVPNLHQLYRASRVLNGGHRTSTTLLAKFHTGGYKHLQGLLSFPEVPALTYILLPALTNLPESLTIASKLPPGLTTVPESQTIRSLTMLWSFLELQTEVSLYQKPFPSLPKLNRFPNIYRKLYQLYRAIWVLEQRIQTINQPCSGLQGNTAFLSIPEIPKFTYKLYQPQKPFPNETEASKTSTSLIKLFGVLNWGFKTSISLAEPYWVSKSGFWMSTSLSNPSWVSKEGSKPLPLLKSLKQSLLNYY